MNLIARQDLQQAYRIVKSLRDEGRARDVDPSVETGLLRDAVERLCNVIAEIDKDLSEHTNAQGPHTT